MKVRSVPFTDRVCTPLGRGACPQPAEGSAGSRLAVTGGGEDGADAVGGVPTSWSTCTLSLLPGVADAGAESSGSGAGGAACMPGGSLEPPPLVGVADPSLLLPHAVETS